MSMVLKLRQRRSNPTRYHVLGKNRMGIGRGRVGLDPFPASGESLIDQIRAREADKRRKRHEEEIRRAEETERERETLRTSLSSLGSP